MSDLQKEINSRWVSYDKFDRNTWPQVQDGSIEALCELRTGRIEVSSFYSDPDTGPDWGSKYIEDTDIVVRYTDVTTFKFKEISEHE